MERAHKVASPNLAKQAQEALRALSGLPDLLGGATGVRLQPGGSNESVTVPQEAFELFLEILDQMASGRSVSIVPVEAELTTQQAADLLNVSRPFLIKLLDEGKIPVRLVGSHRRVKLQDLLAFKEADDSRRRNVLDELTAEAQLQGLGYE